MRMEIKRVYETASDADGIRILVDRLWPRGLSKKEARVDLWVREVAPSTELRRWFNHDPEKWVGFKRRYLAELNANELAVQPIREAMLQGETTLLFAAKDVLANNAVVLKDYLMRLA